MNMQSPKAPEPAVKGERPLSDAERSAYAAIKRQDRRTKANRTDAEIFLPDLPNGQRYGAGPYPMYPLFREKVNMESPKLSKPAAPVARQLSRPEREGYAAIKRQDTRTKANRSDAEILYPDYKPKPR